MRKQILEQYNRLLENEYFDYQDKNQERVIHSGWDYGNNVRYVFEGAGDIFRELTKSRFDKGYINAKIRRIEEFLSKEMSGKVHPEDSYATCYKHNEDKIKKMIHQWENQPHVNHPQIALSDQGIAIKLNLKLLKGNFEDAKIFLDILKDNLGE